MSADFIIEFYFKAFGIDLPETLHMRAPRGETVMDPHRGRGHVGEIARRFPDARYAYHPELSRSNIGRPMAAIYYNAPAFGGAAALGLVGASIMFTSVVIPETSTATRMSGVTGQPSIGTAGTQMIYGEDPDSILDLFTLSYWRGY